MSQSDTGSGQSTELFRGAQSRDVIWARAGEEALATRGRLRRRKNIRRALLYHLFFGPLMTVAVNLPGWFTRGFLRIVFEPISYRATRRVSIRNLERVYGDAMTPAQRQKMARAVTRNFLRGIEEHLEALRVGRDRVFERIDTGGADQFLTSLLAEHPGGFLGLTGHLGNWELLGSWIGQCSERELGGVVAKRNTSPYLNARIERMRSSLGMPTYYREDPPGEIVKALRRGKLVAIVPDQDVKSIGGMFVDFLGHPAYTPTGPARLALAAGVPIVCGAMVRTDDGGFRIEFEEPIWPDRSAPRDAEIERLTRAWCAVLETLIRRHPEQWAWFHERWKTTPQKLIERGRGQVREGTPTAGDPKAQRPENSAS